MVSLLLQDLLLFWLDGDLLDVCSVLLVALSCGRLAVLLFRDVSGSRWPLSLATWLPFLSANCCTSWTCPRDPHSPCCRGGRRPCLLHQVAHLLLLRLHHFAYGVVPCHLYFWTSASLYLSLSLFLVFRSMFLYYLQYDKMVVSMVCVILVVVQIVW